MNPSSHSSRSLCWALHHNTDKNQHSQGEEANSNNAGFVIPEKVPLVPHSHFNGLARTRRLGFRSSPVRSTELTANVVFVLLPTPLAVGRSTMWGSSLGWAPSGPRTGFVASSVGSVQALGVLAEDHPPGRAITVLVWVC